MVSRWNREPLEVVRDLRLEEEVAVVAMAKDSEAEEEEKAEVVEAEVKVETVPTMLDQEPVLLERMSKDTMCLTQIKREEADSKARPETPIHSTDNLEEAEVPETPTRRRAALAEATGDRSQTNLTSKVATPKRVFPKELHLRSLIRSRRVPWHQPRLRKKSNLKWRLKKSSLELVSMIS